MFARLVETYHLHPIVDHFTIALLAFGIAAELFATAAVFLYEVGVPVPEAWSQKLRSTALILMVAGAAAAVASYFTGDAEADRLWDTMSPASHEILASTSAGTAGYLSHAVLGQYLMYAFLVLAVWRVMIEFSRRLQRTRIAFAIVAVIATGALLYQGKTGGELVYDHGVGTTNGAAAGPRADSR